MIYRKVRSQVNETQQRLREIEDFIDKRAKLFSPLQPPLETMRLMARSMYRFYSLYNPEFALFGCLFQYARIEYPEVVSSLRIDEMRQTSNTAYEYFVQLTENFLKTGLSGDLSNGRKLAPSKTAQTFLKRMPRKMTKRSTGQLNLSEMYSKRYRLRIKTEPKVANDTNTSLGKASKATQYDANQIRTDNKSVRQPDTKPAAEKQTEKPVDSKGDSSKRKIEKFSLEKFVLRSIGIDPDGIKQWTPTYCGKEYVKNFMRRFFNRIVLV